MASDVACQVPRKSLLPSSCGAQLAPAEDGHVSRPAFTARGADAQEISNGSRHIRGETENMRSSLLRDPILSTPPTLWDGRVATSYAFPGSLSTGGLH